LTATEPQWAAHSPYYQDRQLLELRLRLGAKNDSPVSGAVSEVWLEVDGVTGAFYRRPMLTPAELQRHRQRFGVDPDSTFGQPQPVAGWESANGQIVFPLQNLPQSLTLADARTRKFTVVAVATGRRKPLRVPLPSCPLPTPSPAYKPEDDPNP
jgi:hypothetical protein